MATGTIQIGLFRPLLWNRAGVCDRTVVTSRRYAFPFALVGLAGSLSWMGWYSPRDAQDAWGYFSAALQMVGLWWLYVLVDAHLRRWRWKLLVAAVVSLICAYVVVDALLLRITCIRVHHAFSIIWPGGNWLVALQGAGFTPWRLMQIGLVLLAGCAAGALVRLALPEVCVSAGRASRGLWAVGLGLVGLFVGEQFWSSQGTVYQSREMLLPGYLAMFSQGPRGFTYYIPAPPSPEQRRQWLAAVQPARRPQNVVFILLEGVRGDLINPRIMPNCFALAGRSWNFTHAYTVGASTHLAWNTLLMDRPAYTFWVDAYRPAEAMGATPLEILRRAGYEIYLSVSTLLDYKGMGRRLRGLENGVVTLYQGAHYQDEQADDPVPALVPEWDVLETDRAATDHAIQWIRQVASQRQRPFFLLMNYDATHFPYRFDPAGPLVEPDYLPFDARFLATPAHIRGMHKRYLNAVHQVDAHIGRLMAAFEEQNLLERTVIVITSDHGQSFIGTYMGNSAMIDTDLRVPLVMHLPDLAPRRINELNSHQHIWATLYDYLGIDGIAPELVLGRSMLQELPEAVLIVDGPVRSAYLRTPECILRMKFKWSRQQLTFFPYRVTDPDGHRRELPPQRFAELVEQLRPSLASLVRAEDPLVVSARARMGGGVQPAGQPEPAAACGDKAEHTASAERGVRKEDF